MDPIAFAQDLIRCPSVTPRDAGALDVLQRQLAAMGFACHRLTFGTPPEGPVENLFARLGTGAPHFCFAGHTDVVPPGNPADWSVDPFEARIENGILVGRGAADMKASIAAFVTAVHRIQADKLSGSISMLITGDEEGPALYGTKPTLAWMAEQGHVPDHCLVGEPTSVHHLGDTVKIGRRGSLNAQITVLGAQGHVAYPDRADNPITRLVRLLEDLKRAPLDAGTEWFDASNLEITNLDVGNPTENMIPAQATARLNIRFNPLHSGESLSAWLRERVAAHAPAHEVRIRVSGESFLTTPGDLSALVADAIHDRLGRRPALSTSGGTSDARFIRSYCPVIEFGLPGQSMHKVDEHAAVADIVALADVYETVLRRYFDF